MTQQQFHKVLNVFIREALIHSADRADIRTEVVVHLQPNSISLTGEYFIDSARHPLDLRAIGKATLRHICEIIKTYHFQTTQGGVNKWNVGKWTYTPNENIEECLLWGVTWEEKNKKEREIHRDPEDLTEPKWH